MKLTLLLAMVAATGMACVIAGCAPRYGSNSLIVCSHESWAHKGYEETPNEKLLLCYREDKGTW